MAYSGEVALIASTTVTTAVAAANGAVAALSGMDVYRTGSFVLSVTAASGTFTLNVYIQSYDKTTGVWFDIASFTQATGTGSWVLRSVGDTYVAGTVAEATTDGTLSAGTVRPGPWGTQIRGKYVTTGSGFSVTFAVGGELKG